MMENLSIKLKIDTDNYININILDIDQALDELRKYRNIELKRGNLTYNIANRENNYFVYDNECRRMYNYIWNPLFYVKYTMDDDISIYANVKHKEQIIEYSEARYVDNNEIMYIIMDGEEYDVFDIFIAWKILDIDTGKQLRYESIKDLKVEIYKDKIHFMIWRRDYSK